VTEKSNKIIFIPSCDKYADLWNPFFDFKDKYWNDAPYPVILSVNTLNYTRKGVQVVKTGPPSDWSGEIRSALNQTDATHLLLLLEDYFIYEKVNTKAIERLFDIAMEEDADFLRLGCFPKRYNSYWPYTPLNKYKDLAEIVPGARYRINLQVAIWKKSSLLDLLVAGEHPWAFELKGSVRANNRKFKALCVIEDQKQTGVHGPVMYIGGAITGGKWMLDALRLAKKNNIPLDTSRRKVETAKEEKLRKLYISTPLFIRPAYKYIARKLGVKW